MGYENLLTFTKVDPNSKWSITATRATALNMPRTDDSYIYKDYVVDHFTDFEHWFDWEVTSDNGGRAGLWAVTNDPESFSDSTNGIFLTLIGVGAVYLYWKGVGEVNTGSVFVLNTNYYGKIVRSGTTSTFTAYPTALDRVNNTNIISSISLPGGDTTAFRYLQSGYSWKSSGTAVLNYYIENFDIKEGEFIGEDTLTLSDSMSISLYKEQILDDNISLSDQIELSDILAEHLGDTVNLSDEIYLNIPYLSKKLNDTLSLSDVLSSSLFTVTRNHLNNYFSMFKEIVSDVNNDVRTLGQTINDLKNDVRFIQAWQSPGEAGFQSLGKEYVKVYIDSIEETTIDVDSITITQNLNTAHISSFILGLPYDSVSKPTVDSEVEIKYNNWTLFKGYINNIAPGDSPDNILVNCKDEYWKQNRTNKYFKVGHKPGDNTELYYDTITEALSSELSWSPGIGNFVPETIDCFGTGSSDCLSTLIPQCGNYNWFYHVDKNSGVVSKKLQIDGNGDIINIDRQIIGQNLGLYQLLQHQIYESVDNIINKFRVQMGNITARIFNNTGGNKEFVGWEYRTELLTLRPGWSPLYENTNALSHPVEENKKYKDVFNKYTFPFSKEIWEEWTDTFSPKLYITIPFGGNWKLSTGAEEILESGFTVDYREASIFFDQRIYMYQTDEDTGEITALRAPLVQVFIAKKKYYSSTDSPSTNPETTISNPLMFFTDKMGSYSDTIMKNLELSQFSIQYGGWHRTGETEDGRNILTYTPSWNDTIFAKDFANWQLSKNCDKKITGTIDLTIDAMCFYDIDLSNRIMINGVLENSLNIKSISYNLGSWKASITLENGRLYKRTTSLPSHGI